MQAQDIQQASLRELYDREAVLTAVHPGAKIPVTERQPEDEPPVMSSSEAAEWVQEVQAIRQEIEKRKAAGEGL